MASRKQRSGSKRGPSNVEETRSPNNRQRLKEVQALKLDFAKAASVSPTTAKYSSTATKVTPVDVKIIAAGEHLVSHYTYVWVNH